MEIFNRCIFFILLFGWNLQMANAQNFLNESPENLYALAKKNKFDSNTTVVLLKASHDKFLEAKDTVNAIKTLLDMPYMTGIDSNYATAYDAIWKALFLADSSNNLELMSDSYMRLGRLYGFFKREKETFNFLGKAIQIKKELIKKKKLDEASLVKNYRAFCATYIEMNKTKLARIYLDSCFLKYNKNVEQVNIEVLLFEKACILTQEKKYKEALKLMQGTVAWFKENNPSFMVLVNGYLADIYYHLKQYKNSEKYCLLAIDISNKSNRHIDFTPLIYEKLAKIYNATGQCQKSYASLIQSKELDAQFFGSRNASNNSFLQIKDEFRLEKEKQKKLIQEQKLDALNKQHKILRLRQLLLIGGILFLIIISWLYLKQIRIKHKTEKLLIKRNKELEIKKNKELLELKNKELTVSALQLVEKDEFLWELKSKLKGDSRDINLSEINKILKSISISSQQNWDEFKMRFSAVNEGFYQKLKSKYPKLTPADLKLCALIKLNLSSKEIAKLLGIKVESAHSSRYMLRKKMNLSRDVNLEEFISKFQENN